MGEKIRGHIRSNVIGYVALFVALSGTAYATHPGGANTIDSTDIIDDQVKTQDLRDGNVARADIRTDAVVTEHIATGAVQSIDVLDNNLTGTDVLNNSLTGDDIQESSLGIVPNANQLDGQDSSEFAPANPANTLDIPDGETKTVLGVSGLGELSITHCETTNQDMTYSWDNTSSTDQDVWTDTRDLDDTPDPLYGIVTPTGTGHSIDFTGAGIGVNVIEGTLRIRPVTSESFAATIHLFAHVDANRCRVSAQAVLSG